MQNDNIIARHERRVGIERRRYTRVKIEQSVTKLYLKLTLVGIVASWVFIVSEVMK